MIMSVVGWTLAIIFLLLAVAGSVIFVTLMAFALLDFIEDRQREKEMKEQLAKWSSENV